MFTVEGLVLELEECQVVLRRVEETTLPRIHCPFSKKATEWKTTEGVKQLIYDIFLFYFDEHHMEKAVDTLAYLVTEPYFTQYQDTFNNQEWIIARYQLDLWFYDWLETQRSDGMLFAAWSTAISRELHELRMKPSIHWLIAQYLRNVNIYVSLYEITKEAQLDFQRSNSEGTRTSEYRTI